MKKNFSIKEALSFAWKTLLANFWLFLGIVFIFLINQALPDLGQSFLLRAAWTSSGISTQQWIIFGLFLSLYVIINSILIMGVIRISLDFYAGEKPGLKRLFSMWSRAHVMVAASLLFFLMTGTGYLFFKITEVYWYLLLFIPGVVLGVIFWFYDFALVDKKTGLISTLQEGAKISYGARFKLFLFLAVLFLIIVGTLIFTMTPIYLQMAYFPSVDLQEEEAGGSDLVRVAGQLAIAIVVLLTLTIIISLGWLSQAYVYCKLRDFSSEQSLTS